MDARNEFAAIILLSNKDEYILQLRDNKPTIVDPGKLSLFAGRLKARETHLQAAVRELFEETTLKDGNLQFYKTFHKDPARHGAEGICYVYILKNVDPARLAIHEGQGYRLSGIDDLTEQNTALISYDILLDYAQQGRA